MRLLTLGGAGFIGSRVVEALREHEVVVFHTGRNCETTSGAGHIHGEASDLPTFRAEFARISPEVVVDLISRNESDARLVIDSVQGIAKRVVVLSSVSVYRSFGVLIGTEDAAVDNTPATEDAPLRTNMFPYREVREPILQSLEGRLNDYDKIAVERAYGSQSVIDWTIIRLPMVYGPGDPDQRLQSYLNQMSGVIYLKQTVVRWRNSRAYVENVAQAIRTVIFAGKSRRTYNYAEPENDTEATWISRIAKAANWSGEIRVINDSATLGYPAVGELPKTANFAQDLVMDSTRIRNELGFVEPVSRDEAMRLTIDG